jgi:hypothetical protein
MIGLGRQQKKKNEVIDIQARSTIDPISGLSGVLFCTDMGFGVMPGLGT